MKPSPRVVVRKSRNGTAGSNPLRSTDESMRTTGAIRDFQLRRSSEQLAGRNLYSITFPKGQVLPVHGFWSVTVYNGVHFFKPKPLKHFFLGTKNKNPKYNADGSLT